MMDAYNARYAIYNTFFIIVIFFIWFYFVFSDANMQGDSEKNLKF